MLKPVQRGFTSGELLEKIIELRMRRGIVDGARQVKHPLVQKWRVDPRVVKKTGTDLSKSPISESIFAKRSSGIFVPGRSTAT